ncbi:putative ecdysone oxidase [Operophtera brumata]|uniref:Putative ecdysone oxidase n=1 Tax=Operophtera brumata TaxID=104452 RepID=A0A0L7KJ01_OPEBR|nr:putative ecdysone oxidase [Operophtera brumata]
MSFYNDSTTCQNQQPYGGATAGKMLGGSGSINHMIHVPAFLADYILWAKAANDSSWSYDALIEYFTKSETVTDEGVLAQNSTPHGTCGPLKIKKQESSLTADLIAGLEELGVPYKNDTEGTCVVQPLLAINNGLRQCGNVAYLSKLIDNENVTFLTSAIANRVIFNGTKAVGVEFQYNGTTYQVLANSRTIIAAGALNTPKILMQSGVGDNDTLTGLGINTTVHNPEVGQNLMDHPAGVVAFSWSANTTTTSAADPFEWPVPMVTFYDALNQSQNQPDIQYIMLVFPPNSNGLLQLCGTGFKYLNWICDTWYEKNINSYVVFIVANLLHPNSRGCTSLNTTDTTSDPITKLGLYSNDTDLDTIATLMHRTIEPLLNSTALQSLGAEFVDLGICTEHTRFSQSYWKCYALAMSSTMWHYAGTCMMGKVVDGNLSVMGTTKLSVVDASVFPALPSGNIGSTVVAVAEKGADIIKTQDGLY